MKSEQRQYHAVEYEGGDYIRFTGGGWYEWMGESLEPAYCAEEFLEKVFQEEVECK